MPKIKITKLKFAVVAIAIAALAVGFMPQDSGAQSASDLQQEIDNLNQEIDQNEDRLDELRNKKDSLENRLEILDAEAEQIQSEINVTEQEINQTQSEIQETEEELERTKELIQENVKVLYKEGSPSTMEVLFSSDNFTDFVNKQEYLDRVKSSLNEAARESVELKEDLEEKEIELQEKADELDGQKQELSQKQEEQQELIEQTEGEEDRFEEIVESQQEELEEMRERQRRAYEAAAEAWGDNYIATNGSGGYPWDGQGLTAGNCSGMGCVDDWNLYKGQCTSYVAWRLANEGYKVYSFNVPGYGPRGNAAEWPETTTDLWSEVYGESNAAKIRNNPESGYAAVDKSLADPYGHVMYVEEVIDSSTIRISEYNFRQPDSYSVRDISTQGLEFIEFSRQ